MENHSIELLQCLCCIYVQNALYFHVDIAEKQVLYIACPEQGKILMQSQCIFRLRLGPASSEIHGFGEIWNAGKHSVLKRLKIYLISWTQE